MRRKIVVIGSLNYDILLKVSRLPRRGETFPVSDAAFSGGGKGANQAVQAAKLGVDTCLVGCVGEDVQGDYLLQTAQSYGVDTRYVRRCPGSSGIGIVHAVDDGSVYATIVRGANFEVTREDVDAAEEALREAALVILEMEIPQEVNEYAIEKAKECGCLVLLNAAPAAEMADASLRQCDILVVNEVEAAYYLGHPVENPEQAEEGARLLSEKYGADVIITLGSLGAVISDHGAVSRIPPVPVKAVETTGAGDSFIGGVGYALLEGESLREACEFAARCSAVTVCRIGAQSAMPTLAELKP